MGTNYYLETKTEACPHCGHFYENKRHIGKSSAGWCFSLHVYPDDGIHDLEDWIPHWHRGQIVDECDVKISVDRMLEVITERSYPMLLDSRNIRFMDYCAVPGPNNLLRYALGSTCIKHGSGTWDCLVGDFS